MNRRPLPRREFLKGIGKGGASVAIGLPLLEAMIPGSIIGSAEASERVRKLLPQNRMLLLYYPNGIHTANWYPTDPAMTGADYQLAPSLAPLERHKSDFLLLGGMSVPLAELDHNGDHAKAAGCYLTGVRIHMTSSGDEIQAGASMDQIVASRIGHETRFPSLELGLDYGRMEGGCDPGYACIYSNNISWRNEVTPAIKDVNPRIVFDRLFGHAGATSSASEARDQQEMYNRSILDFVMEGLGRFNRSLGVNDRIRVDEYLTSIREIERRLDSPPVDFELPPGVVRPTRVPDSYKDHFHLMADMQILALQQDMTRVSTFMLGVEQSRRTFSEIGIPEEHHGLTHHAGNAEKIEKVCKIDTYMVEQFGYFLDRMKEVKEGESTLLDNSMVILGNGNGDAARHDHKNCATIIAGRGGGTLSPGRYIRYNNEPVSNLWLSLMDRMGVEVERHGDSTGRLQGLSV